MANRNTSPEKQTEQSQHINTSTPFQSLKDLPITLSQSQCVLHKHEILICGGYGRRACYSYHTLKNEYKFICEYPSDVYLEGHCVVKLVDNNNDKDSDKITLLSFGSNFDGDYRHTLVMKYVSVWSNDSSENEINKSNNYNQWVPFTDNQNHPIIIGDNDNYVGVRAVIGGSNNHLLFITYWEKNISVFNLNTFQVINDDTLPIDPYIYYHCFVSNSENEQEKNKEKIYEMLLFYEDIRLSIEYDEDNNNFQFYELTVCDDIEPLHNYAYVCISDTIFFFGGNCYNNRSKSVYKYLIRENKLMTFENTLPSPLEYCAAILNEEDNNIHIIGGIDNEGKELTHMKTKVRIWDASQLSKNEIKFIIQHWIGNLMIKLGWIDDFDRIIFKYSRMK
ncbi:hypothetical protein RFI_05912 [Reticulomyxa filosa]|uniref:Kelch motif family protein n=1 Tax=Reticulomyxa filosa TaxID=46433 RepID=X6NZE3_RETFI|nr:hypothetical protein RFI_05912 [Reticulomyxa filosa]|eukprot:ETO31209.1 hypothetical protein RFI_05912 [Reticulomyxa filosa]